MLHNRLNVSVKTCLEQGFEDAEDDTAAIMKEVSDTANRSALNATIDLTNDSDADMENERESEHMVPRSNRKETRPRSGGGIVIV